MRLLLSDSAANSNFVKVAEMISSRLLMCACPHSSAPFRNSAERFYLSVTNSFSGNRGSKRSLNACKMTRNGSKFATFTCVWKGSDFRICGQCLPSVALSILLSPFSRSLQSPEALAKEDKNIVRDKRGWRNTIYTRWKSVTTMYQE